MIITKGPRRYESQPVRWQSTLTVTTQLVGNLLHPKMIGHTSVEGRVAQSPSPQPETRRAQNFFSFWLTTAAPSNTPGRVARSRSRQPETEKILSSSRFWLWTGALSNTPFHRSMTNHFGVEQITHKLSCHCQGGLPSDRLTFIPSRPLSYDQM